MSRARRPTAPLMRIDHSISNPHNRFAVISTSGRNQLPPDHHRQRSLDHRSRSSEWVDRKNSNIAYIERIVQQQQIKRKLIYSRYFRSIVSISFGVISVHFVFGDRGRLIFRSRIDIAYPSTKVYLFVSRLDTILESDRDRFIQSRIWLCVCVNACIYLFVFF